MAKSTYPKCQAFTFRYEGGYVNHPKDPGRATNYGITKAVLAGWRKRPVTDDCVRTMTKKEAAAIYRANYWNAVRGDELPKGVDLTVWDYGVNSGPSRAIKDLQRALGVKVDGFIGAATITAAQNADPVDLVTAICDRRRRFVRALKPYKTFGKGWERRIAACRSTALAMIENKRPAPVGREAPQGKADPADKPADKGPPITSGSGAVAGGGLIEGAIDKADRAADAAQKVEGWAPFLERLAGQPTFWIGLAILGVCAFFLFRYFTAEKDDD